MTVLSIDQINQIRNLVEYVKQHIQSDEIKRRQNDEIDDEHTAKRLKSEVTNNGYFDINKRVEIFNHKVLEENKEKEWNTLADGLCGFRSLACWKFGDQERYPEVIDAMRTEYLENRNRYDEIFGIPNEDDEKFKIPKLIDRLTIEAKDNADLWFENDCVQLAADTFETIIVIYSLENTETYLPMFHKNHSHNLIVLRLQGKHYSYIETKPCITIKLPPLNIRHAGKFRNALKRYNWRLVKQLVDDHLLDKTNLAL